MDRHKSNITYNVSIHVADRLKNPSFCVQNSDIETFLKLIFIVPNSRCIQTDIHLLLFSYEPIILKQKIGN